MIPKVVHFAYFYPSDFPLYGCLAVKSAEKFLRPESILLYRAANAPDLRGEWWENVRDSVEIVKVQPPTEICGQPLNHPAHQADVFRLRTLLEQGGIYLDLDTMCCNSFDRLLEQKCVLGHQTKSQSYGLCNAVILAEKQSAFLQRWLEEYHSFRSTGLDQYWDEHSVRLPLRLAKDLKGSDRALVHIEPYTTFFDPGFQDEELTRLFERCEEFPESLSYHLWAGFSYKRYLARLSLGNILEVPTTYNLLARRVMNLKECPKKWHKPSKDSDFPAQPSAEAFIFENRKYCLVGRDKCEGILSYIRQKQTFFDAELLQFIKGRELQGTYVDVGANIGNHSVFFLCETRCSKLVSTEANAQLIPFLEQNVTAVGQDSSRCQIVNAIISCQKVAFFNPAQPPDEPYGSYVSRVCLGEASYPAEPRTLDDILNCEERITLFRVGIESNLVDVLKSGEKVLKSQSPEVCLHVTSLMEDEVYQFMAKYNYLPLITFPGGIVYFVRFHRFFLLMIRLAQQLPRKISSRIVWRFVRLVAVLSMGFPIRMFNKSVPWYPEISTSQA